MFQNLFLFAARASSNWLISISFHTYESDSLSLNFSDKNSSNSFEELKYSPNATACLIATFANSPTWFISPLPCPSIPKTYTTILLCFVLISCRSWKCYADLYCEVQLSLSITIVVSCGISMSDNISSRTFLTKTWSCFNESEKYG